MEIPSAVVGYVQTGWCYFVQLRFDLWQREEITSLDEISFIVMFNDNSYMYSCRLCAKCPRISGTCSSNIWICPWKNILIFHNSIVSQIKIYTVLENWDGCPIVPEALCFWVACPSVHPSICLSVLLSISLTVQYTITRMTEQPTAFLSVCPKRFPGLFLRILRRNGLQFDVLIYADHLQNWLDFSYGLLIFLLLAPLWLGETAQIWGFHALSWEHKEVMALNLVCWCIWTTFRSCQSLVMVCQFFFFCWCFSFVKLVRFEISKHFHENAWEESPKIWCVDVPWLLSELIRFWAQSFYFPLFEGTLIYWHW